MQVVAFVPVAGPGAAAQHGRHTGHQRFLHLLWADKVDVRVYAAGGQYLPFAGDDFSARTDQYVYIVLYVRVAGLADGADAPLPDAEIGFDDARSDPGSARW